MTLPEVTEVREVDEEGGDLGSIMGLHIDGHVEDDVAVALAWEYLVSYGSDSTIDRPRRRYVYTQPIIDDGGVDTGSYLYVYGAAPKDGEPVTVVDFDPAPYRPCVKCPWQAVRGIPVDNCIDPPANDGKYVWMCKDHAADFWRRYEIERRRLVAEIEKADIR